MSSTPRHLLAKDGRAALEALTGGRNAPVTVTPAPRPAPVVPPVPVRTDAATRRRRVVELRAEGVTVEEVAAVLGVHRATVLRDLKAAKAEPVSVG